MRVSVRFGGVKGWWVWAPWPLGQPMSPLTCLPTSCSGGPRPSAELRMAEALRGAGAAWGAVPSLHPSFHPLVPPLSSPIWGNDFHPCLSLLTWGLSQGLPGSWGQWHRALSCFQAGSERPGHIRSWQWPSPVRRWAGGPHSPARRGGIPVRLDGSGRSAVSLRRGRGRGDGDSAPALWTRVHSPCARARGRAAPELQFQATL